MNHKGHGAHREEMRALFVFGLCDLGAVAGEYFDLTKDCYRIVTALSEGGLEMVPQPEELNAFEDEVLVVMSAWKLKPGVYQIASLVPAAQGSGSRPVIDIGGMRYVMRRQPPDLTENDTRFRHA